MEQGIFTLNAVHRIYTISAIQSASTAVTPNYVDARR
jgi:hypothetical protein